jgi:hypothetical protein
MKSAVMLSMLMLTAPGCTLIKSTLVTRQEDNSFVGQSNGQPQDHGKTRPYRGVPVALKVPTHVDVAVTETYFIQAVGDGANRKLQEVVFDSPSVPRNMNVTITPVVTKKLFTVDFVRPAAGTLDYKATFTDDQYFQSIENTIVDETIKDITAAIKTVAPALGLPASATIGTSLAERLLTANRTVAYARFDIDAPDFEEQLNSFLTLQVNACHNCEGRVAPGVPCAAPGCLPEVLPIPADGASQGSAPFHGQIPAMPQLPPTSTGGDSEAYFATPEYTVYPYVE